MGRLLVVVFALVVLLGSPAHAQTTGEHIDVYGFDAVIEDDGDLVVTETIAYDFGSEQRHGIFRDIPTRLRYDDRNDRVYRLEDVEVDGGEGTPTGLSIEDGPGGTTRLRIGDADTTITGKHAYEIRYRLE